jgi:hypothetical protein
LGQRFFSMFGEEISGIAGMALFGISQADARGTEGGAWVGMALYPTHGQVCRATWITSFVMVLSPLISKHALDLREQAVEQPEVFFR